MVMIFTSMLHRTVWRKYVRSGTLKARNTENVLEIFRNPDNSSVFLQGIELGVKLWNKLLRYSRYAGP